MSLRAKEDDLDMCINHLSDFSCSEKGKKKEDERKKRKKRKNVDKWSEICMAVKQCVKSQLVFELNLVNE